MGCGLGHGPGPRAWPPDWTGPLENAEPPRAAQPGRQRNAGEIAIRNISTKGNVPFGGYAPVVTGLACLILD